MNRKRNSLERLTAALDLVVVEDGDGGLAVLRHARLDAVGDQLRKLHSGQLVLWLVGCVPCLTRRYRLTLRRQVFSENFDTSYGPQSRLWGRSRATFEEHVASSWQCA